MYNFIIVFFLSSVKFLFAIPLALVQYKFTFFQTLFVSSLGGFFGVFFFYYCSNFIIEKYNQLISKFNFNKKKKQINKNKKRSLKKIITIKILRKYGLYGIAFLTPIFFSIPIGTFLASKFYRKRKITLTVLLVSVLFWSLILSLIVKLF